jgi:hypothetical protein
MPNIDSFVSSYIRTLLWSETDEFGESLDVFDASDISPGSLVEIIGDCESFAALASQVFGDRVYCAEFAHNFCLTRNGHGAGFWDGDFDHLDSEPDVLAKLESDEFAFWTRGGIGYSKSGRALSAMAKSFGTQGLSISNDGRLYVHW